MTRQEFEILLVEDDPADRNFRRVVRQFDMYWLMVNHMPPAAAHSGK